MPEAIILGSGTSTGVPIIGKSYPAEYLANPKNHRLRSSLLLRGDGGDVLVDAGPDARQQLLGADVTSIECVLITHTHADHIMGMDDLRAFCLGTKEPVRVIASKEHQKDIRRVFAYAFGEFPPGIFVPRFSMEEPPELLREAGMEIKIFWVDHGPMKVMGIRVNDFAYLTDVNGIPDEVRPLLEGLDHLVLDAVRHRPHPNHFCLQEALEEAQRIGAETTWLTHLSDDYDHDVDEPDLPPCVRFAYDGLKLTI